jgi:hypothetical protein
VFSATLSAYSIEPGEEKANGADLLVSFHDNDHYNSVRDEKSPPKPPAKRNKQKSKKLDAKTPDRELSQASDSTTTTTTTASSTSDTPTANKSVADVAASQTKIPIKKSAPCPCGSGLRYKKCCQAKEKHAARLGKLKMESPEDENEEVTMKGNFRVLHI